MEDEKILYRLWIADCCDHNPKQIHRLLQTLGEPEEIFKTNFHSPKNAKLMRIGQRLRLSHSLDGAKRRLEACREKGISILSIDDAAYPQRLKEVFAPPQLLYVLGDAPDFNQMLGITVVGARKGTQEGALFAEKLGKQLGESGVVVVGGMALGIDAAAHWGALEAGGTTVAVLAGGVDVIYPEENADLYRQILTHGCIISEQPPGVMGKPYFYQDRNRIMVGLSYGVAVAEGKKKSGTSLTVRLAKDANADIFAVPGNPLNPFAELPNDLLRDGCKPLTEGLDILEEYIGIYPEKLEYGIARKGKPIVGRSSGKTDFHKESPQRNWEKKAVEEKPILSEEAFLSWMQEKGFSESEMQILRFLRECGERAAFDEIEDACKMETGLLSSQLIILQMKGAVTQSVGGQYELKK